MKKSKVLFFGPYPKPYTGQSIAFKEVYEHFESSKIICNITRFEDRKICNSIFVLLLLPWLFITNNIRTVYFTCSRSNLGFVKDLYLIFFAYIFRTKIVNHLHGGDFNIFYEGANPFIKKLIKWAYDKVDISIVLTEGMISQFKSFDQMKIKIVPNSYSKDFSPISWEKLMNQKNADAPSIIFMSNIMYSKGIVFFLEALHYILKKYSDFTVDIAGVPMQDYLKTKSEISQIFESLINKLQKEFPDRIKYHGLVTGKAKETLLQKSSIFILPSIHRSEAFPISIIEAMYFGNAIVTTNINYLPEIIKKENGILTKPSDVEDLKASLDKIIGNKVLLSDMQKENYHTARHIYNPNQFCNSVYEVIEKI